MDTTIEFIGQMIKELRQKQGLTLDELAEKSGCTPSFISQVERSRAIPSVTTLYAISETLGVPVTDFFPKMISASKVTREGQRESFHFEGSSITYSPLSTKFRHGAVSVFLMTISPSDQALPTDELRSHNGEEFFFILDGVLRLWVGNSFYDLYPGDSAYYKSTHKHRMENLNNKPAIALALVSPSFF
jgi:transcriptional regulator with XRE-family HTH domain